MSSITRTLCNLWKIGFREFFHQMQHIGDTKSGRLVGIDKFGNKFYENHHELPLRTRWVDYKSKHVNVSEIEPGWHAWISHMVDQPPLHQHDNVKIWAPTVHKPTPLGASEAYRPYNTTIPKFKFWIPQAKLRH